MTDKSASFVYVTFIRTTPEKVFEAITRPEIARRYWGHENVSEDWRPGSAWQHIRTDEARTVDLVGEVIESDPPKRLVISWVNESQKDDPDQYSRVTFDIEPQGEIVKLTVMHDDLQPGSGMLNGISKGWPYVLSSMKSFLETGRGMDL
ncbi:SRPBCC family protein [Ensifer sp. LCM 4579]|uniref:SRPBCC family protein n=1 Tax=Ensifer sp. LCM 4579 TaxID=1848292 RepID=UPI0008DB2598|nr:SRPBCC family protein [Ensifer sp. LCM 4579]OHV77527.1 polyketide cyclase [Ensifer sp. LCM 4579]